jgi:hypothetical protein
MISTINRRQAGRAERMDKKASKQAARTAVCKSGRNTCPSISTMIDIAIAPDAADDSG